MQVECARYVNTRFAPHPPIGPQTPPATSSTIGGGSSGSGGPLASPFAETAPSIIIRDDSRFDTEEVWPVIGDPEDGDSPKETPDENSTAISGIVDGVKIVELYASLKQGQSVKQWYAQHSRELSNVDIRRFITFGVIKGFLYRVHKYACATGHPAPSRPRSTSLTAVTPTPTNLSSSRATTGNNTPYAASVPDDDASISPRDTSRDRSGSRGGAGGSSGPSGLFDEDDDDHIDDSTLSKYLDGTHCFDQICTELEISERELTARLKKYPGEVLIIHR